jgi:Na+/proline symporter
VWFISLAIGWGAGLVVFACTVHDRCSESDPACVFHSYTLLQRVGPGILGFAAAPLVISLVLAALLHAKTTRRSHRADRAAWFFAVLSCLICLVGLNIEGIVMLPEAVLTVCAVATAPFPPDLTDPLAARSRGAAPRLPPLD